MTASAWWTFVRSRKAGTFVITAVLVALGSVLTPDLLAGVPGTSDERAAIPLLLAPFFLVGPWTVCAARPSADLERMVPTGVMVLRRGSWYLTASLVLAVCSATALSVAYGRVAPAVGLVRNVLLGIGMGTAAARLLPVRASWTVVTVTTLFCWFFGTIDGEAHPAWWAVPNYWPDSVPALVVCLTVWFVAGVVYALVDGRSRATDD